MTISIVGTPQVGSAPNGGNVTLTFDVSPSENDYVLVFGGVSILAPSSAPGTGYTQIALNASNDARVGAWIKKMGASPDTSVLCRGNSDADVATAYMCFVLRGVDTSTPQDQTYQSASSTSTNPNAPSITTVTANAWVFAFAGSAVSDSAITGPSGYSNHYTKNQVETTGLTIAGATFEKATAGAEDPGAWSNWASGGWYAITIALRPAASGSWANIAEVDSVPANEIAEINTTVSAAIAEIDTVAV